MLSVAACFAASSADAIASRSDSREAIFFAASWPAVSSDSTRSVASSWSLTARRAWSLTVVSSVTAADRSSSIVSYR